MSLCNIEIRNNVLTKCAVSVSSSREGNAYGGGVSVYIGGYASVYNGNPHSRNGTAVAAVGWTMVRNVSVVMSAIFSSFQTASSQSRSFGGSLSFYIGGYAYAFAVHQIATSTCGATTASNVSVSIHDAPCYM